MTDMTTAHRHGDPEVLAFFDQFTATPLAELDRYIFTEDGSIVVAGVNGTDLFGTVADFICDSPIGATVAVKPSTLTPLVVFTMNCTRTGPLDDGICRLSPDIDFVSRRSSTK